MAAAALGSTALVLGLLMTRMGTTRLRPAIAADVIVLTGSFGRGHDAAAESIAQDLRSEGRTVQVLDVVALMPARSGELLKWVYFQQLRHAPITWQRTLSVLERHDGALQRLYLAAIRLLIAGPIARSVTPWTRHIISTHPFASGALGELRAAGCLDGIGTSTYLCDPSVHPMWIHPAVDRHLALYPVAAQQARARGAQSVDLVAPAGSISRPEATRSSLARDRDDADIRPTALVVGGSEGVGDLEQCALELLATGLVRPVIVCGRNTALHARMRTMAGVDVHGWVDDLPGLMSRCDLLVNNAGGATTVEALRSGLPIVFYRPLAGHGRENAAALEKEGLALWPRDAVELPACLEQALAGAMSSKPDWGSRPAAVAGLSRAAGAA